MTITRRTLLACAAWLALPQAHSAEAWDDQADVLVVGAGAAGLSAACAAADMGSKVLVLEKRSKIGGNTWMGGGYINAVDTVSTATSKVKDSVELFAQQTLEAGGGIADPELVRTMAEKSLPALHWLESKGVVFHQGVFASLSSRWPRGRRPVGGEGEAYIRALSVSAVKSGVRIETGIAVKDFLLDSNGRVCGVSAQRNGTAMRIHARKGVVMASGGFGANPELVRLFAPKISSLPSINVPEVDGSLLLAAQRAGAKLRDMDLVECFIGHRPGGRIRGRLHGDDSRYLLVNNRGERFIREDADMLEVQKAILALPNQMAYLFVDDDGFRSYSVLIQRETIRGVESGDVVVADTLEELARQLGIPASGLVETVRRYNASVESRSDPLGKAPGKLRHKILTPPFWAAYAPLMIYYTLGGVSIDRSARVLKADGNPLAGLYAAGETTGGIHGQSRVGGNGLTDAVVFGKIAGESCSAGL